MAFLVIAAASQSPIDPQLLHAAGGGLPITWFAPDDPSRGGIICLSSLTSLGRLKRGDRVDCVIVGRIRLDRAEELRASRRATIALLDQLPEAVFIEMFGEPSDKAQRWPLASSRQAWGQQIRAGPPQADLTPSGGSDPRSGGVWGPHNLGSTPLPRPGYAHRMVG